MGETGIKTLPRTHNYTHIIHNHDSHPLTDIKLHTSPKAYFLGIFGIQEGITDICCKQIGTVQ